MLNLNPAQQLLTQFCDAYKNRDLKTAVNLFTKDASCWGSGVDEYRVGSAQIIEQLQRDWQQSEKAAIKILSFVASPPNASWAAAICQAQLTINGQDHVFDDLRGTIIIKKEDNVWKIAHMHASFPDYRNPDNSSFPVK